MSNFDDAMQKVKGHVQQEKAKLHEVTGDDTKAFSERVKGKYNEKAAELKMKLREKQNEDSTN